MKSIKLKLYKLNELNEAAQQKAIEQFSDINLDFDWWQFVYDDFKNLCSYFGIAVDLKKTYFNGFYHQGQGCSYTADIEVVKLVQCRKDNSWKQYAPDTEFQFCEMKINSRLLKLIDSGIIDMRANVKPQNREASIKVTVESNYTYNSCQNYDRIETELENLEELVTDVCEELNFYLFKRLRDEYDYLASDAAVKETITANEYDFRKDGQWFH